MATELQLSFWERGPPLAAIAAAQLLDLPCNTAADDKFTKDSQPALQITSEKYVEVKSVLPYTASSLADLSAAKHAVWLQGNLVGHPTDTSLCG